MKRKKLYCACTELGVINRKLHLQKSYQVKCSIVVTYILCDWSHQFQGIYPVNCFHQESQSGSRVFKAYI